MSMHFMITPSVVGQCRPEYHLGIVRCLVNFRYQRPPFTALVPDDGRGTQYPELPSTPKRVVIRPIPLGATVDDLDEKRGRLGNS